MSPDSNPFKRALGHVWGAVFETFSSEVQLVNWITAMNAQPPDSGQFEPELKALTAKLGSGWVFSMLNNEDRSEEAGIINEAVLLTARKHSDLPVSRKEFAYRLTNLIVNKGIRSVNRTAQGIETPFPEDVLINEVANTSSLTDSDHEAVYRILAEWLKCNEHALDGLKSHILIDVMKAWLPAIEAVEMRTQVPVRPNSMAVLQEIAERLKIDVKTVEAATKRIKRAVRRQNQ